MTVARRGLGRLRQGGSAYLIGALCILICTITLMPLVVSVLASVKSPGEAAAVPPTYLPETLSVNSYQRLWDFQSGLLTYVGNSLGVAFLTIAFTIGLTVPAAYALARFSLPAREVLFVFLLLALIIPDQALLTPIFLMFAQLGLTDSVVGLAVIHTAIQMPFSLYIMRNAFEAVPRELEEAAVIDGANSWQLLWGIFLPAVVPALVTVALFAFVMSWNEFLGALVMMNRDASYTLPVILSLARTQTSLGGTDWGMLQAGVTIAIVPCIAIYLLLQRYYVSGFLSGAVK